MGENPLIAIRFRDGAEAPMGAPLEGEDPDGDKKGGQRPFSGEAVKDPQGQAPLNDETLFKNPYAALEQIARRLGAKG